MHSYIAGVLLLELILNRCLLCWICLTYADFYSVSAFHFVLMFPVLNTKVQSMPKFVSGILQWVHKHNLSTTDTKNSHVEFYNGFTSTVFQIYSQLT
jgi:hypothetical protein